MRLVPALVFYGIIVASQSLHRLCMWQHRVFIDHILLDDIDKLVNIHLRFASLKTVAHSETVFYCFSFPLSFARARTRKSHCLLFSIQMNCPCKRSPSIIRKIQWLKPLMGPCFILPREAFRKTGWNWRCVKPIVLNR